MENVGIIICARVKSSRIHEKVLQKIGDRRAIEILLDRVINTKYPVVLAIPSSKDDDILEDIALNKGVECYRGDDLSPLHRLHHCAKENGYDYVVRITADDILIDLEVLFNQIRMHINGGHEYSFCSRIPDGCAAEVINAEVLEQVVKKVGNKPVEFISYYIKNKFKTFEYYPHMDYQKSYRLVMDYPEDLMLLRILFAAMQNPGILTIIDFLKRHPYFTKINKLPNVTVYTCNYNTADYIIDSIKSVLSQTYKDFEYIIIDDNSTDDSMNRITEFYSSLPIPQQNIIKIIRNDKNIGLPASCNRVLEIARGKYIVRLDSDDVMKPDYLQKAVEDIHIKNCHGVITGYDRIDETGAVFETIAENMWHPGCSLLSRWVCNELKYRDDLKYLEGKEFFERFNKMYKVSFVPESLWQYRRRPGQKTQDAEHPNNIGELKA